LYAKIFNTVSVLLMSLTRLNGTAVNYNSLEQGLSYVMAVLDLGGLGGRLVQDLSTYWWILLLSFLVALVLSLLWIGGNYSKYLSSVPGVPLLTQIILFPCRVATLFGA